MKTESFIRQECDNYIDYEIFAGNYMALFFYDKIENSYSALDFFESPDNETGFEETRNLPDSIKQSFEVEKDRIIREGVEG